MNWQVRYALENLNSRFRNSGSAEHIAGDAIRISIRDQPDTVAVIAQSYEITHEIAIRYYEQHPEMDFLCGYRSDCIWTGEAIDFLTDANIGWGNSGTLNSAIEDGNVNRAAHKDYFFSYRLVCQMHKYIRNIEREFDRVFTLDLNNGNHLRVGMMIEYEPTADAVRSLWDRLGPFDVIWNINPNGNPTDNAIEAGRQLGCEVLKWTELKDLITRPRR